jgi:TonB family protein
MPENVLVVEYEPRYTDRVRQALAGQPFSVSFARDGDEAVRALDTELPRLIVVSSVVPKIATTELIRMVRARKPLADIPILLTVSGYNGKSPKVDAQRVGATDILPKPYSETEVLTKVREMLGLPAEAPAPDPQFTTTEISAGPAEKDKPGRKTMAKPTDDVDKMLADTLAGMMPKRKAETPASTPAPTAPASATPQPPAAPKPRSEFEKTLHDTLSGLEKVARKTTSGGTAPRPSVPEPPAPAAPAPPAPEAMAPTRLATDRIPTLVDRTPVPPPPAEEVRVEDDEPADGVRFGQYVLVEKIATGGMAEVWKARMRGVEGFQKIVAIKKILPHLSDNQDFIEMFVDEAKLAAQLNHNNIIHIYDLGKIQSSYYIAMEFVDGYDLKNILRRAEETDQPMSVELALFVVSKVAAALDYAHRKRDFEDREMGLVHRDVSPQNVLISQEGDIKLCDFGIAKAASKASHTQAGALKGKLQYMSPEQAWGRHVDRRSDIFALATVMFEMLTARKLFGGDNELSILDQVRAARVQPPSLYNDDVTPAIDAIVLKALQLDPDNRYQTAGEMAREIDAILYDFKPTPTSADLAIYMHRISSPEPVAAPAPASQPVPVEPPVVPAPTPVLRAPSMTIATPPPPVVPVAAPAPVPAPEPVAASTPLAQEPPKKKPVALFAAAGAIVVVLAGAGYVFMTRKGSEPAATPVNAAAAVKPQPAAAAPVPVTTDTTTTAAATATSATIDPTLVDQEVQKRLAAERARLEAQARTAQQAANRPAPAQVAQATPAPVTPAPVAQETRPAPAPVQQQEETPAPAPQVAEPVRPAPQQPAVQRAREGDLVAAGTEGLNAPRMLRRGTVPYPTLARQQRVQGTVVTSVLVSETGAVLEVRILRGVNRPVGLNEAAEQTMRRSQFAPATKDGVRVRSWLTVPVEFKL